MFSLRLYSLFCFSKEKTMRTVKFSADYRKTKVRFDKWIFRNETTILFFKSHY